MRFLYAALILWSIYFAACCGFFTAYGLWRARHPLIGIGLGLIVFGFLIWVSIGPEFGLYQRPITP